MGRGSDQHHSSSRQDELSSNQRKSQKTRWGQSAAESRRDSSTSKHKEVNKSRKHHSSSPESSPSRSKKVSSSVSSNATSSTNLSHNLKLIPGLRPGNKSTANTTTTSRTISDVASRAAEARAALEKAKKALALHRQMGENVSNVKSSKTSQSTSDKNVSSAINLGMVAALRGISNYKPMRFDRFGREVDAEGNVIEVKPLARSTLKVNINKEREAKLKKVVFQAKVDRNLTNPNYNRWYDPSLNTQGVRVRSRGLCFIEKGFYMKKERHLKAKSLVEGFNQRNVEESKSIDKMEIDEVNKTRDISKDNYTTTESQEKPLMDTVVKETETDIIMANLYDSRVTSTDELISYLMEENAIPIDDNIAEEAGLSRRQEALHILQRRQIGIIPDVEWWDQPLLKKKTEAEIETEADLEFPYIINESLITELVEHPVPIPPVVDYDACVPPVLHLTPKERAKLQRRKRKEKEKDKQDKIRMGLIPPPPPKVKLANLMRVLGTEAASNPSKIEQDVRLQVAERERCHLERNEARRLDAEAKRKKNISKWTKSASEAEVPLGGAEVCVFIVKDLSNRAHLYKVDKNAQQYHVTGAVIICPPVGNLIIAEGSRKALRGYKKLLIRRIKWDPNLNNSTLNPQSLPTNTLINSPSYLVPIDESVAVLQDRGNQYCRLIWEGVVKDRAFKQWKVYVCKSEGEVRKILIDHHSEQYWDMLKKYRDPFLDL